jgi:hypothetical protein
MKKLHSICLMICTWIIFSFSQAEACSVGGRVVSDASSLSGRPGVAFVCFGSSATLNVRGETGSVVRWEFSDDSTSWTAAPSTSPVFTTAAIMAPRWYRAVVKSGACPEALSNALKVEFEPPAVPGTLVSDKTNYECTDSFRVRVRGFNGRIAGFKFNRIKGEDQYSCGSYTRTIFTTDSFCVVGAERFTTCDVGVNAMIVNLCGDTVETAETILEVGDYVRPVITFSKLTDTMCLHGGSIKFKLNNYDGRTMWWGHNLWSSSTQLYEAYNLNSNFGRIESRRTVYPVMENGSFSFAPSLPDFVSKTGPNEFTIQHIDNWNNLMHESWFWDTTLSRYGKFPELRLYVSDSIGCDYWHRLSVPIHYPSRSVGGVVETDRVICSGNIPGPLNLFGHEGRILRWESSTDAGRTWTTIALTGTSFTPPPLTTETWYRAVVDNNTCDGPKPSQPAKISIAPTPLVVQLLEIVKSALVKTERFSPSATIRAKSSAGKSLMMTAFIGHLFNI